MKLLMTMIAATVLMGPAHAAPSKGKLLTMCKTQVSQIFGEEVRIRTKRIRDKKVTLVVKAGEAERQTLVCTPNKQGVYLAGADGRVLNHAVTKAQAIDNK